jgi:3-(methylsulfanyl)propanoyl-CoA dehydrogenase
VPDGNGRLVQRFVVLAERDLAEAAKVPALRAMAGRVRDALHALLQVTGTVMARAARDPDEIGAAATDYLRMFGLVATGWMWVRMAATAIAKAGEGATSLPKVETANFYVMKLLPQTHALAAQIEAGAPPVMALDASAF